MNEEKEEEYNIEDVKEYEEQDEEFFPEYDEDINNDIIEQNYELDSEYNENLIDSNTERENDSFPEYDENINDEINEHYDKFNPEYNEIKEFELETCNTNENLKSNIASVDQSSEKSESVQTQPGDKAYNGEKSNNEKKPLKGKRGKRGPRGKRGRRGKSGRRRGRKYSKNSEDPLKRLIENKDSNKIDKKKRGLFKKTNEEIKEEILREVYKKLGVNYEYKSVDRQKY